MTREQAAHPPADRSAPRVQRSGAGRGPATARPRSGPARLLSLQRKAGNAAVAAMVRAPAPAPARPPSGPPVVQRFEAQHHEHVERASLTAPSAPGGPALTDAESSATYFGNWSRDMSQAFVGNPVVATIGEDLVFEILNAMAIQKFGREINARDFGVYSPREHIDNPAGQINADLLLADRRKKIDDTLPGTQDEDISGTSGLATPEQRAARITEQIAAQFTVNAAGLPAYLGRSRGYVTEELATAADLGRTEAGLMHLGNALHTTEDLFAHSNYLEIAVGKLFTDGRLPLTAEFAAELAGRRAGDGRAAAPVDTLSGFTTTGRPILTTGTFVGADTQISLSEAVSAFLAELTPGTGSAPNRERSQHATRLLLARYEKQAESGAAGTVVRTFLGNVGPLLRDQLAGAARRAVAGEQPAEGAGVWARGLAWVRGAAGAVAGAAAGGLGGVLSSDAVLGLISDGINTVGTLPLTSAYDVVCKVSNGIDGFFDTLHQVLHYVPGYETAVKPWIQGRREELRDLLRAPVVAAIRFTGQLLQRALAEQQVRNTSIARQIQIQIGEKVRTAEARAQLARASIPEQIAMLTNPQWCGYAAVDDQEAQRIAAMLALPDYAKAGPSHSQVAKDHADSPFFGTAASLAMAADSRLRDRIIAVWTAEGRNSTAPGLGGTYADEGADVDPYVAARRPAPGKPEAAWTPEEAVAEREAATAMPHHAELTRRLEGERLRADGALPEAEEDHGVDAALAGVRVLARTARELPDRLRGLAGQIEDAAPAAAGRLRRAADAIPSGIEDLARRIEAGGSEVQLQDLARAVRALAQEKRGLLAEVGDALRAAADEVANTDPTLDAVASSLRSAATAAGPFLTRLAAGLDGVAETLSPAGDGLRSAEQKALVEGLAPVATGEWAPEFAADRGRAAAGAGGMSGEREALFAEARELFQHPYDTTWWEGPVLEWCRANQARLEAYIRARNAGVMHHHRHD